MTLLKKKKCEYSLFSKEQIVFNQQIKIVCKTLTKKKYEKLLFVHITHYNTNSKIKYRANK